MSGAAVAFRVDASALIGAGHAMRCLSLADRLKARGAETIFVCGDLPEPLAELVAASGHRLHRIAPLPAPEVAGGEWDLCIHPPAIQQADADWTCAAAPGVHWTVVDHYGLDSIWERSARATGRVLVIDDLANRPHDCDLLLDQNFGARRSDYHGLVSASSELLCGSTFALLRPEFAQLREAALARRAEHRRPPRLLVSLGATDVGGITAQVIGRLVRALPNDAAIDVVIPPQAPSAPQIAGFVEQDSRLSLHRATSRMAELMLAADLALGAAGTTSWERCALGLPAVVLALAANQQRVLARLAQSGAVIAATDTVEAVARAAELIYDHDRLGGMSAAAFALADGEGSERVASRMISPPDATK